MALCIKVWGAVIIVPTIITQRQFPNSCPVLSTFVSFQISSQFDEITPKNNSANFPLFLVGIE
jgi:hypothetical protein